MARRTPEQLIADYKKKIKEQEEKLKASKSPKLTKDSAGIAEAIDAVVKAADANKVNIGDVIMTIATIKRCGLKIEKKPRVTKKPN